MSHFIIMDNAVSNSFVQHFLIPLLQAFRLRDPLVCWVAVEDVIIPFTGWTGPDMTCCKADKGTDKVAIIIKRVNVFYFLLEGICVNI